MPESCDPSKFYPLLYFATQEQMLVFRNAFDELRELNHDVAEAILHAGVRFEIDQERDIQRLHEYFLVPGRIEGKRIIVHHSTCSKEGLGVPLYLRIASCGLLAAFGTKPAQDCFKSRNILEDRMTDLFEKIKKTREYKLGTIMSVGWPDAEKNTMMDAMKEHSLRAVCQAPYPARIAYTLLTNWLGGVQAHASTDSHSLLGGPLEDAYMTALKERKKLRERYAPGQTAFAVNTEEGGLTPPQQHYFEHVNKLLALLAISPDTLQSLMQQHFDSQLKSMQRDPGCGNIHGLPAINELYYHPAGDVLAAFASGYVPMHSLLSPDAILQKKNPNVKPPGKWIHDALVHVVHERQKQMPPDKAAAADKEIEELNKLLPACAHTPQQEREILAAEIAQRDRQERKRQKRSEEEIQAAVRASVAAARKAAFHASPQPYPLDALAAGLAKLNGSQAPVPPGAILKEGAGLFDIRRADERQLGEILFAPGTLKEIWHAFGMGQQADSAFAGTALNVDNIKNLYRLYHESPEASRLLDTMLKDARLAVIPACAALGRSLVASHAKLLREALPHIEKFKQEIDEAKATICRNLSIKTWEEAASALSGDPEIIAVQSQQETLEEMRREVESSLAALTAKFHQTLEGAKPKHMRREQEAGGNGRVLPPSELPPGWEAHLNGEFTAVFPAGKKWVTLSSKAWPSMAFAIKLSADQSIFHERLGKLRAACDAARRLMQDFNFTLLERDGKTYLRHEPFHIEVLLAYDDETQGRLREAEGRCNALRLKEVAARQAGGVLKTTEDSAQEAAPVQWKFSPRETVMLFDAGPLADLGKLAREKLEFFKRTARLSNVKILVPSVIADWELQGRVPVFDQQGKRTGFKQVDKRFRDPRHQLYDIATPVGQMLSSASRLTLGENGEHLRFEPGTNSNIVIVETPGDCDLYARIEDILHMQSDQHAKVMRFKDEIHGQGEGEKSIERVVCGWPDANPFMIISDDVRYLRSEDASHSSGQGAPVSQASLACYLDAELNARRGCYDRSLDDLKPLVDSRMIAYVGQGFDSRGNRGQDIYALITEGVRLSQTVRGGGSVSRELSRQTSAACRPANPFWQRG